MKNILNKVIALIRRFTSVLANNSVDIRKCYYKSGETKEETPYKNGKIHGIRKKYYENGQLMSEMPYDKDKEHGIRKEYYENGKLRLKMKYVNGEVHGIGKWYYPPLSGKMTPS